MGGSRAVWAVPSLKLLSEKKKPECADGVLFEEAGGRVSPSSVDDDASAYGALEPSRSLAMLRVGWCPMSKTAVARLDLAVTVDAGIGCPAVSVPALHPAMADLSSVMCPSWPLVILHISWCGPASSDAVVSIRMTDGAGFGHLSYCRSAYGSCCCV
jgi:hypothetical protein